MYSSQTSHHKCKSPLTQTDSSQNYPPPPNPTSTNPNHPTTNTSTNPPLPISPISKMSGPASTKSSTTSPKRSPTPTQPLAGCKRSTKKLSQS